MIGITTEAKAASVALASVPDTIGMIPLAKRTARPEATNVEVTGVTTDAETTRRAVAEVVETMLVLAVAGVMRRLTGAGVVDTTEMVIAADVTT
jgi:hypothetical protein